MKNNIQNYLNEKLSDITFSDESQAKVMEKIKTLSLNRDKEENTDKVTKEFKNIEKSSVIIEKVEVKDVNKSIWIKYISFAAAFLIIVGSTFSFSKMDSSNNNVGDETIVTTVDFFQTDNETSSVGDEANNDTNESNDFYPQKIENYFIAQQIALNGEYDYFDFYGVANGKAYIIAQDISGMQIDSTYVWVIINEDGIEESKIPIKPQHEGGINDFTINEDGTISFIENAYINDIVQTYIHTMDITGAIISTIEVKEPNISFDNCLIPFIKDKDGNFILAVSIINQTSGEQSTIIYKVNNSGEILLTIEDKAFYGVGVNKIFKMKNGDIILQYYSNFAKVNFENNSIEKDYKFEGLDKRKNYEVISGNDEYELFLTDNMSLYGYNSDEKEVVEIINYVDSDIEGYVKFALPVNKDRMICKIYDTVASSGQKNVNFILKRVDSETLKKVQEKQVLTLAGSYIPWYLSSEVARLNKSNDKFRVKLIDYTKYNTEDDYEAGSKKLNDEILNGNIPDVLILNTMMDTDAYIDKGFLTDMNTFFNSDLDIKKEDYLENIINVFETEGKLYQISPNFLIKAMFGKTSELGENKEWNIEDFNAFLGKNKDKEVVNIGGKALLEEILRSTIDEYINYKEGTCNFENENFIKLIEGIKKYDENRLESQNEDYNYNTYNSLLNMDAIYSYLQMHQIEKGYIGEEITLKYFPSVTSGCASMDIDFSLAISDKSKNKEAAWEFVKMFLKEDFQNRVGYLWGFPIKKSSLEKLAENTKNPTQDIGSPLIQSGLQVGDEYKEIGFIDDQGIEKVNDLIKSINSSVKYDSEIINIIREELYSFYDGNKTAEEVANLIQTRISTYINETK